MSADKPQGDWRLSRDDDDIAWLCIDKRDGSANVLSEAVLEQLDTCLSELRATPPRGLVIHSGKSNGFIAGADVNAFTTLADRASAHALIRRGQVVFDRLEALPFATVCLIHGFCLGGGLELALACRYRVAEDDERTRIGLPEVRLGIHPGFGGTVRLPRLIGAPAALDMMLSGRTVSARAARKLGLVDHAVPARHLHRAARALILDAPPLQRVRGWRALASHSLLRPALATLLRRKVAQRARAEHYPAPFALIDLWRGYGDDPKTMLEREADSVADLICGSTAQNLVRVFLLQERLKGFARDSDFRAQRVHVIGAGTMGGDIAAWCALRGLQVTLQDQGPERIAPAVKRAHALFEKQLKHPRAVRDAMDRLMPDVAGSGLRRADVVIEAIFEDGDAKRALFRSVEPRMRPDALLATNTSSIPLAELRPALTRPERLVGLHFFNPVARMQLVEVVADADTDRKAAGAAAAFTRRIDRLPLPVLSTPGFLVNRVLMPYLLEAVILETEGVPCVEIDRAAVEFGMPMGPIQLADTVGLDICLSVARILAERLGGEVPTRLSQLVELGRLGVKAGRGFYEYRNGRPVTQKSDSVGASSPDIAERLILRLLNEAVACLDEGVIADADLLDAGVIFGTGFAPFRGGPMHYATARGIDHIVDGLRAFQTRYGARFEPHAAWSRMRRPESAP